VFEMAESLSLSDTTLKQRILAVRIADLSAHDALIQRRIALMCKAVARHGSAARIPQGRSLSEMFLEYPKHGLTFHYHDAIESAHMVSELR
jgi:hypothetical protein